MATEAELEEVRRLFLDEGISQGEIAKRVGHSQSTVHRWLAKMDILDGNSDQSKTKKAVDSKRNFDLARRIELNNKFFDKLIEFMERDGLSPSDLRTLAVTYGIIEDKRHLLEPLIINTNEKSGLEEIREDLRAQRKAKQSDEAR